MFPEEEYGERISSRGNRSEGNALKPQNAVRLEIRASGMELQKVGDVKREGVPGSRRGIETGAPEGGTRGGGGGW